jgi:hypothetical protein
MPAAPSSVSVPPGMVSGMDETDYYVELLEAADAWQWVSDQDEEPTDEEIDAGDDRLAEAGEALREFEASNGTGLREEPWGGTSAAMVEVIEAANAWYEIAVPDEVDADQDEMDAIYDRLGDAVRAMRTATAERDAATLRGDYGEALQHVMKRQGATEA